MTRLKLSAVCRSCGDTIPAGAVVCDDCARPDLLPSEANERPPMTNLTTIAQAGYDGDISARPPFDCSPDGMGYATGLYLRFLGLPRPQRVSMSRGYGVRADGVVYDTEAFPAVVTMWNAIESEAPND